MAHVRQYEYETASEPLHNSDVRQYKYEPASEPLHISVKKLVRPTREYRKHRPLPTCHMYDIMLNDAGLNYVGATKDIKNYVGARKSN